MSVCLFAAVTWRDTCELHSQMCRGPACISGWNKNVEECEEVNDKFRSFPVLNQDAV